MSASDKFGSFTDSQLVDWMRSNPGGAAKAFEFWRKKHPDSGSTQTRVEYKDRVKVEYRDRVEYKDRVQTEYVDRIVEVEKPVRNPVNVFLVALMGLSLTVGGGALAFAGSSPEPQVITKTEVKEVVKVVKDDSSSQELIRLQRNYDNLERSYNRLKREAASPEMVAYMKMELRTAYGIICQHLGRYCERN